MAAVALLAVACATDPDAGPAPTTTERPAPATGTTTADRSPADVTSEPGHPPTTAVAGESATTGPFAVGTRRQVLVDQARGRHLDTLVYYPATRDGAGAEPADGTFPLALMAHGYRLPADGYERMLTALTRRGYLVAAPDFPHTTGNGGDGNRADIVNQPADLAFVADAVVDGTIAGLPGVRDPGRMAVMGHSDGGLTASAMAYNTRYRDPRVAAAVVMTGGRALFPGSYFADGSPPLLAVHGTADETNGFGASVSLFDDLPTGIPGYLVRVDGGSHLGPFMFDTGMPELGEVIAEFLDAHLAATPDPDAAGRLVRAASRPPLSIESR